MSRDLHRVARCATRIIPSYIRVTCFIYMMCHAGDTSAAAELRVQLRCIINLLWLPNAIHGIHYLTYSYSLSLSFRPSMRLFKKIHRHWFVWFRIINFVVALFCHDDRSTFLSLNTTGNVTNGKRKLRVSAILFSRFIGKRPNLICGNLKLPNVNRMNYRTSPQRASNDSSWRVPAIDSPCVPFDEDLNFAKADSDLHRWDRSNTSRSGRNDRARAYPPWTYPKCKRYMEEISRRRLYIMQIPG